MRAARESSLGFATLTQLGAKLVSVVCGLASLMLLTRHLGASGYGVWATAIAYVTLVGIFGEGGLSLLTVRELSEQGGQGPRGPAYVRTQLVGRLALSTGVTILAVGAALVLFRHEPSVVSAVLVLAPLLPSLAVASTLSSVLQARLLLQRAAAAEALSRLASLGAVATVVVLGGGLWWCLLATSFGWVLQVVLLWVCLPSPRLSGGGPADVRDSFAGMLWRSLPLGVASLVNGLYFRLDAVMVALMAGVTEAGRYAVAYRFLDALLLVPGAFAAAALPVLARLSPDLTDLVSAGNRCLRVVLLAVSPVVVAGLIAAPALVTALGGADYAASGPVVRVLLVGGWFSSVDIVLGLLIIVSGLQGRMLWLNLSSLATNILGNLVLIPLLGSLGAALMTAGCEGAVLVVASLALRRLIGFRFEGSAWRPAVVALAALTATAVVAASLLAWPAAVGLSLAVYAWALLRAGALHDVAFLTARPTPVAGVTS